MREMNQIATGLRLDNKHRICLTKALKKLENVASGDVFFNVFINKENQIVLDPQVAVPAKEAWLFQNKEALESVKQGLEESAKGETRALGSFAEYAQE